MIKKQKGISAIIAVIMILMITVALAGMAYVWFTTIFSTTITSVGGGVTTETQRATTTFSVESARNTSRITAVWTAEAYVRNTGSQNIDLGTLAAYVDNVQVTDTATGTLAPGAISSVITLSAIPATTNCDPVLKMTIGPGVEQFRTINAC